MTIFVIGLNHKSAPIDIRDKVSINSNEIEIALNKLKEAEDLKESFLLSTCNRTELYGLCPNKCINKSISIKYYKSLYKDLDIRLEDYLYFYTAEEAVNHMFKVAAGLDSLALGEPQILGQFKDAYRDAAQNQNTGPTLNRLMHKTFEVTKYIRTNTKIGEGTTSIGFAAVEMAQKIFGSLSQHKVLVIGAGETGTLTANQFQMRGVTKFFIANRTFETGKELADKLNGSAIRFNMINEYMEQADIVVSCIGAPEHIISPEPVINAMKGRKNKPLFFIDLGMPRDINPKTKDIYNVFVFDIDDLKEVVDSNLLRRKHEIAVVEEIINGEVKDFFEWYGTIGVVPKIKKLQEHFESLRQNEININRNKLKDVDIEKVELLTKSIIKKILKDPILRLKDKANTQQGVVEAEALMNIFNLNEDKSSEDNS